MIKYFLFTVRESPDGEIYEGNNRYEGYAVDIIDNLSKLLKFTYKLEIHPDNKPGTLNKETNEWNGLIRHILDGVGDIFFFIYNRSDS